jgi:hypothetical protein
MPGFIDPALPDLAHAVAQRALPERKVSRATSCLFFAAAADAALRKLAVWRFVAGGAFTHDCVVTGWGLFVSPRDNKYFLDASTEVDPDDGSYVGHCWAQAGTFEPIVVDVMTGYCGPRHKLEPLSVYHAVPKLTRSVSAYHREALNRVRKSARRDEAWVEKVQAVAMRAMDEAGWGSAISSLTSTNGHAMNPG